MGSMKKIEQLMRRAVLDSVIHCMYCEYEPLEADYDTCPECGEKNPLKEMGLI